MFAIHWQQARSAERHGWSYAGRSYRDRPVYVLRRKGRLYKFECRK